MIVRCGSGGAPFDWWLCDLCQKQPTLAYTPHSGNGHNIGNRNCHLHARDLERYVYGGSMFSCGSVGRRICDSILGSFYGNARIRDSVGAAFDWLYNVAADSRVSSS